MKSIRLWTVTISSLTSDRQDRLAATLRCKIITINFNCSVLKFQRLLLSSVPTPHHTSCFSACTPYLKAFDSSLCATSPGFSYHLGGQVWGLFPVSLFQLLPVLFWRIPPDFNLYVFLSTCCILMMWVGLCATDFGVSCLAFCTLCFGLRSCFSGPSCLHVSTPLHLQSYIKWKCTTLGMEAVTEVDLSSCPGSGAGVKAALLLFLTSFYFLVLAWVIPGGRQRHDSAGTHSEHTHLQGLLGVLLTPISHFSRIVMRQTHD